jgi:hypothetical protein
MSTGYGPQIITDGLVLYLDSTIERSYPSVSYGPELVTEPSVLTAGDGQVRTISSIGGNYLNFGNIAPCVSGKRYKIDWIISARRGTTTASLGPGSTPSLAGGINLPTGSYSRTFTCSATGNFSIVCDNVNADFDLDYLSIKEVLTENSTLWKDISGNNRDFVIGGGVYENNSLLWTSGNSNAYEVSTNSVSFDTSFSLDTWFVCNRFDSPNSNCGLTPGTTLWSKQGTDGNLYRGFRAGFQSSGRFYFNIAGINSTDTGQDIFSVDNLSLNTLYSVVCMYSKSSNQQILYLYINGTLVATNTLNGTFSAPNQQFRLAGSANHCSNWSFFGKLFSVKMYNKVLSPSEIKFNYERAFKNKYSLL